MPWQACHAAAFTHLLLLALPFAWAQKKFHGRWNYTWRDPVHEMPYWTGADGAEHVATLPNLRLHHHADHSKSRSSYFELLKLGVEEDPGNAKTSYYYGYELYTMGQVEAAIAEFERYLALPGATWKEQRAAVLRMIARSHQALGRVKEAQRAALRGVLEVDYERESWLELAQMSRNMDWHAAHWAVTKALALPEKRHFIFFDDRSVGWWLHDLAALAAHNTGHKEAALRHGKEAAALQPNDARLKGNLQFYLNSVQQSPSLAESTVLSALRTVRPSGGYAHCSCLPLLLLKHPAAAYALLLHADCPQSCALMPAAAG